MNNAFLVRDENRSGQVVGEVTPLAILSHSRTTTCVSILLSNPADVVHYLGKSILAFRFMCAVYIISRLAIVSSKNITRY